MRLRNAALAVIFALVGAACGSDDDTSGAESGGETSTTAGASDTTAHDHADGESHDHGAADGSTDTTAHVHEEAPKPAEPLALRADGTIDPDQIYLGGIDGVSAEEQARAEDLLRRTVEVLPKWSDREQAIADGFKSIGDGLTGEEHLLRWDWIEDDVILDPNYPESLVYNTRGDAPVLEAAMYILPDTYTLDTVPNVGGKLTQFHIHDNLCFTTGDAPQVAGLTNAEGGCNPPLVEFSHNPQVHVWIRANECGPFASLLGVGAGQIKEGEERTCTKEHGSLSL